MMLSLILVVTIAAVTSHPLDTEWEKFKLNFGKSYDTMEEAHRRRVWEENRRVVAEHNREANEGLHTYWMKINQFGDLTAEEFLENVTGGCFLNYKRDRSERSLSGQGLKIPAKIDWRLKNVVTPVKDQRHCGSCWAFSTTGSLEGMNAIKTQKLISFSEQQLVDCDYDSMGCFGGLMTNAMEYTKKYGIESEQDYPYKAADRVCKYSESKVRAKNTGYVAIKEYDEMALTEAIATAGPVSVAIDAAKKLHLYSNGIFYDRNCSETSLNHGVLAVGYGSKNGKDFYIVKNSWGTSWGENGYIRMARNRDNNCGIASEATYPTF